MSIVDKLRNIGASREGAYVQTNLAGNTAEEQEELGEITRSTYSLLKRDPSYMWETTGTSPNVTNATLKAMNNSFDVEGRYYFENTPVGIISPMNEFGHSKLGYSTYNIVG